MQLGSLSILFGWPVHQAMKSNWLPVLDHFHIPFWNVCVPNLKWNFHKVNTICYEKVFFYSLNFWHSGFMSLVQIVSFHLNSFIDGSPYKWRQCSLLWALFGSFLQWNSRKQSKKILFIDIICDWVGAKMIEDV